MKVEETDKDLVKSMISTTDNLTSYRLIEEGIALLRPEPGTEIEVEKSSILYFFSKESFELNVSISDNNVASGSDSYLMVAHPFADWSFSYRGSNMTIIAFSISKLHELFGSLALSNPEDLKSALKNYRSKTFYTRRDFSPAAQLLVHTITEIDSTGVAATLLLKGKFMELLALYMDPDLKGNSQDESCPYIKDNLDWEKIREAERVLIRDIQNPPTIRELAKLVGTNELKLKTGFKHLFGNTIYGYLTKYRMDFARLEFEQRRIQVKEMADMVGYSNPSHFIAAFRKRFGVTPKKYIQSLGD